MKAPLTIFGSSTDAPAPDVHALSDAGFTWLHLEGASYLRMPQDAATDAAEIVVTVVGVADSSTVSAGWLLLA